MTIRNRIIQGRRERRKCVSNGVIVGVGRKPDWLYFDRL